MLQARQPRLSLSETMAIVPSTWLQEFIKKRKIRVEDDKLTVDRQGDPKINK
jgi:hypothetical protein